MKTNILRSIILINLLAISRIVFAHDFESGGIYYDITSNKDKTVAVTHKGDNFYENEYTGSVVIPESVTYNNTTYSVTSIGTCAFYKCTGLTSLTIGNSVTSIGLNAFNGCTGLTSITIPNSVTDIDSSAFEDCYNLTNVTIPSTVTLIGYSAFDNTAWYNNLSDGIIYINNVLYKYKGTMPENTSISIKEGTISINDYAFSHCTGLTSLTIPNSVTSIGLNAFNGCTGLTIVTIPNSVTSIGERTFCGCI